MEQRALPSKDLMDPNFKRMYYVRYADDFIIGLQGTHGEVVSILEHLKS